MVITAAVEEEVGGRELPLVLPPLFHEDGWAEGGHSAHVAQMDQKKYVNSWGKKGKTTNLCQFTLE